MQNTVNHDRVFAAKHQADLMDFFRLNNRWSDQSVQTSLLIEQVINAGVSAYFKGIFAVVGEGNDPEQINIYLLHIG